MTLYRSITMSETCLIKSHVDNCESEVVCSEDAVMVRPEVVMTE